MKMIMAVVLREEARHVLDALVKAGFTATFTESRGGMLRQAQYLLFIAVDQGKVDRVLKLIRENCHSQVRVGPTEMEGSPAQRPPTSRAKVGGAVVFVWDLDQFETC